MARNLLAARKFKRDRLTSDNAGRPDTGRDRHSQSTQPEVSLLAGRSSHRSRVMGGKSVPSDANGARHVQSGYLGKYSKRKPEIRKPADRLDDRGAKRRKLDEYKAAYRRNGVERSTSSTKISDITDVDFLRHVKEKTKPDIRKPVDRRADHAAKRRKLVESREDGTPRSLGVEKSSNSTKISDITDVDFLRHVKEKTKPDIRKPV
eukprot:669141_1